MHRSAHDSILQQGFYQNEHGRKQEDTQQECRQWIKGNRTAAPKTQIHQDLKTRIKTCTQCMYHIYKLPSLHTQHGVHVHKFVQININEQKIK